MTLSRKSLPYTESMKTEQIARFVRQCFDIQDTYGKTPDQLKTIMMAMIEDLSEFSLSLINEAFVKWRRTSPKIPTPFDIRKLVLEIKARKMKEAGFVHYADFEGGWPEYKKYLEDFEKAFEALEKKNFSSACLRDHSSARISE